MFDIVVSYVPWLHMHQPLVWKNSKLIGNLEKMLHSSNQVERWNAKLMIRAYKNPAKYVILLKENGFEPKIVVDFSGVLLENLWKLENNGTLDRIEVGGEKIGKIISLYQEILDEYPESIEFAGTAYSHSYFPATPVEDWKLQIKEWREVFKHLFGVKALKNVKGFWLPEMGVPGYENTLNLLVKNIRKYYEWVILPIQSVKDYEKLSYEKRKEIFSKPHMLETKSSTIKVVFRAPAYFIDQQAGASADFIKEKIEREIVPLKGDRIVITASDGENGNVMMNEFFPQTFTKLYTKILSHSKFTSFLVSEFLEKFYKNKSLEKIELKTLGASWIDGHSLWKGTSRKDRIRKRIEKISKLYHYRLDKEKRSRIKKLLLISETSCYLYWGNEYWYSQAEKTIKKMEEILKRNSVNFK